MTISWGIQPVLGRRRILHPGKWLPARAISWAVFSIFAIVLSFGPAMEALAHALPKEPALQFLAHAVGAGLVLGAYALLVKFGEMRTPTELALPAAPAGVGAGLVVGLAMFSTVMAIMVGFGLYRFDYHGGFPPGTALVWRLSLPS